MLWTYLRSYKDAWLSLMTGALTIPLTVLSTFVEVSWQRWTLAALALVCFLVGSFRVWAQEHEKVLGFEARERGGRRPFVVADYSELQDEDENTGQPFTYEQLELKNVGETVAMRIELEPVPIRGALAVKMFELQSSVLSTNERIVGTATIRHALIAAIRSAKQQAATLLPITVPVVLRYRDLSGRKWETRYAATVTYGKAKLRLLEEGEQVKWSDLSPLARGDERR